MKTPRLIELQRQRLGLIDDARAVLEEIKTAPSAKLAELDRRHDELMRSLDLNGLDIDQEKFDGEERAQRPDQSGEGCGQALTATESFARAWSGGNRTGWQDQDGNPVRVLRNDQRMATESATGISLGDTVRAMITGPRNELEKRALSEGTSSAGGYTVPAPLATWFIDRLRAQSVAIRAGAMTVPMDSQTLAIARLETDPTIGWRAENAALAEGDPTFGRVLLTAKNLGGIVKVSRELLMDTVNAGNMIEQAFAKAMALEIDRAAIYGSGASNSPTGVVNTASINSVEMAANGATLTTGGQADKLLDAVYELLLDNAAEPTAMIMHPRTAIAMEKLKDGDGRPYSWPPMIARIPRLITTSAPITETQGTAENASSIVFGDFTQLFIGVRHDIEIRMLDQLYAANGQIAFAVHARCDMQLAHKESFCKLIGIIP